MCFSFAMYCLITGMLDLTLSTETGVGRNHLKSAKIGKNDNIAILCAKAF